MNHLRTLAVAAILTSMSAFVLAGCSEPPPPPPVTSTVIIAGSTNSEPVTNVADIAPYLAGIGEGSTVAIVTDEGSPRVLATQTLRDLSENGTERSDQIRALSDGALNLASRATATSPEQNPLEALSLGAGIVQASGGKKQLVFGSSMLQTVGKLPMQKGLLNAEPGDVVAALRSTHSLPDLHGVDVIVVGMAQVQGSQPTVDTEGRSRLKALWLAIFEASDANLPVRFAPPTATTRRSGVNQSIATVAFKSEPVTVRDCRTVLSAAQVGFRPGTADLRDPGAARQTIADVVKILRRCQGQVTITGTTSSEGTPAGNRVLAAARAQAVAKVLANALGTTPADFAIRGLGFDLASNTVVSDRAPDGSLDPILANSNRKVIIAVGHVAAS